MQESQKGFLSKNIYPHWELVQNISLKKAFAEFGRQFWDQSWKQSWNLT